MDNHTNVGDEARVYASTLKEVTDIFESCGCSTQVLVSAPSQAILIIDGPVSFCPRSIFEEHVDRAKELMRLSHPDAAFTVEVREEEV